METTNGRSRGRPRSSTADEAVLQATVALLEEVGLDATTIKAVSERSGVARGSIYLRWPSRDAMISAALRHASGRTPFPVTGDLEVDLRRASEQTRAILSEPRLLAILPSLVRGLLTPDPETGGYAIAYDTVFPNRARVAREYRDRAAEQGFTTEVDGALAVDMIVGPLFHRLLTTGKPPSRGDARRLADVAIEGLRAPATRPTGRPTGARQGARRSAARGARQGARRSAARGARQGA